MDYDEEVLEDPPKAADAAVKLDGDVEDVVLEDLELEHPRRDRDLWAGVGVCLEAGETEERPPQRRRRPSRRV